MEEPRGELITRLSKFIKRLARDKPEGKRWELKSQGPLEKRGGQGERKKVDASDCGGIIRIGKGTSERQRETQR